MVPRGGLIEGTTTSGQSGRLGSTRLARAEGLLVRWSAARSSKRLRRGLPPRPRSRADAPYGYAFATHHRVVSLHGKYVTWHVAMPARSSAGVPYPAPPIPN